MSGKQKYKKRFIYREKSKAWNKEKQTQTPFTLTEGLAATNKG